MPSITTYQMCFFHLTIQVVKRDKARNQNKKYDTGDL